MGISYYLYAGEARDSWAWSGLREGSCLSHLLWPNQPFATNSWAYLWENYTPLSPVDFSSKPFLSTNVGQKQFHYVLCFCEFDSFKYFILVEPYKICLFVTGFFHLSYIMSSRFIHVVLYSSISLLFFFLNISLFGFTESWSQHMGSSSLTRDRTQALCTTNSNS